MKTINNTLSKVYLVLILVLPVCFTSANAAQVIQVEGEVLSLSADTINVNDMLFKMISTVKVFTAGKKSSSLSRVRVGGYARIEIQKYNGKLYVDSIYLMSKPTVIKLR
jgi:hypothetical protein